MKKMRQLPAFSTSRWDSFFYFFLPLDILETCVSYEEKGNSRVNFFLTEIILVHAFRSSLWRFEIIRYRWLNILPLKLITIFNSKDVCFEESRNLKTLESRIFYRETKLRKLSYSLN